MEGGIESDVTDWISTGFPHLDAAFGGGWPIGRVSEMYGPESCVAGSTFLQYNVRHTNGKRANTKGGTIADLYARFNARPRKGKGRYSRAITAGAHFTLASMNAEGRIVSNRVVRVVKTGKKPCFLLRTAAGKSITATAEHKFYAGEGRYVPLSALKVGDTVFVHTNTPYRDRATQDRSREQAALRKYLYVKSHPVAGVKWANGYRYHRLLRSRAVVEAEMNGLDLDAYVERLDARDLDGLQFLPSSVHVHHRNKDVTDDCLENLEAVDASEHGRHHALEGHNKLRFVAVPTPVVSIVAVGLRETYDLTMAAPDHNYIADGIVVHNCGKSALTHCAIYATQKRGGLPIVIDWEGALDSVRMKNNGIDGNNLVYLRPANIERGWELVWAALDRVGELPPEEQPTCVLIIWDSVAASIPKAEEISDASDSNGNFAISKQMAKGCRKAFLKAARCKAHFLFVNQERNQIGGFKSGWGGPPKTTPGGMALKFAASLRLRCTKIETLKDGSRTVGYRIKTTTQKNKCAPPHQSAEWIIDFERGCGFEVTALHLLIEHRVLKPGVKRKVETGGKAKMLATYVAPWQGEPFTKDEWFDLYQKTAAFRKAVHAAFKAALAVGAEAEEGADTEDSE
jgi:RecA/RadA recombinase